MSIKYNNELINLIINLVYKKTGIVLTNDKKILIQNRFNRLIAEISKSEPLISLKNNELMNLIEYKYSEKFINVFTTNKTNFFREIQQFEYLYKDILLEYFNNGVSVNLYSAAASTGEEVWSIAATCEAASSKSKYKYSNYQILATDIDTDILEKAQTGIYKCSDYNKQSFPYWAKPIEMFRENISKCRKEEEFYSKLSIKKELKNKVIFKQMNLMDEKYIVPKDNYYHVIFCRNVLIYFKKEDQTKIVKKLLEKLKPGGYLFLGHSETIHANSLGLEKKSYNIFRKK